MDFWEALAIGLVAFNLSIWTADMVMDLLGDRRFLKKPILIELRINLIVSGFLALLMYLILLIGNEWIGWLVFLVGFLCAFRLYVRLSDPSQKGKQENDENRLIGFCLSGILFRPWFALTLGVFEYGM